MITQQTQHELSNTALVKGLRAHLQPLTGDASQYVGLLALIGRARFPAWMWRNTLVRDFVEWLRKHNTGLSPLRQVGFYGLDLYSLFTSIQAVLTYLDEVDPQAARRARYRYACFDHAAEDSQAYGYAASFGLKGSCEDEVVQQAGATSWCNNYAK